MEYEVNWRIQVEAESPDEAARMCLEIQMDTFSEATFYEVTNRQTGETTTVDVDFLSDEERYDLDELTVKAKMSEQEAG